MAVRVGVGAGINEAKAGFDELKQAIRDAVREARDFASIDLSHGGQLQRLIEDLRAVERGLRAARDTNAASASSILSPGASSLIGPGFPLLRTPGGIILPPGATMPAFPAAGLPPAAPPTTPPPPPPPLPSPPKPRRRRKDDDGDSDGDDGGNDGAGGGGGIFKSLMKGVAPFLTLMGLGGAMNLAGQALGQGTDEAISNDRLLRSLNDVTANFEDLRDKVRSTADGLGVTYQQMQHLASAYGAIAGTNIAGGPGQGSGGDLMSSVRTAVGFARGFGLDYGQTVGDFAKASNVGIEPRDFAMMIGDAVQQGNMQGKGAQVEEALLRWAENASRISPTAVDGQASGFLSMYAAMNAGGMTSGAAQSTIATMNQTLMAGGGGGMPGHIEMVRAMAAAGVTDPYKQQIWLQRGMFASAEDLGARKGVTLFSAASGQFDQDYQGVDPARRAVAWGTLFGINPNLYSTMHHLPPAQMGATMQALQRLGINPSAVNPTAFGDIAQVANAGNGGLAAIRTRILKDNPYGLSADDQKRLQGETGNTLRDDMIKTMAAHGMISTQGSDAQDANANLSNAITSAGSEFVTAMSASKDIVGKFTTEITKGVDALKKWMGDNSDTAGGIIAPPDGPNGTVGGAMGGQIFPTAYRIAGASAGGIGSVPQSYALSASLANLSNAAAKMQGVDPEFARMIFSEEGGLNPDGTPRISSAGAIGAGQLMPGTAASLGVNPYDTNQNVWGSVAYMHKLLQMFHGDEAAAAAAYNAGPNGAGVQYFAATHDPSQLRPETQRYIRPFLSGSHVQVGTGHGHDRLPNHPAARAQVMNASYETQHSIEPLKVVHMTSAGRQLGVEYLPVTAAPSPRPVNI